MYGYDLGLDGMMGVSSTASIGVKIVVSSGNDEDETEKSHALSQRAR